ncbi:MAG: radical SAM protein [Desulfovibrionaceae bacterium]
MVATGGRNQPAREPHMEHEGLVIRPPSEADSILLQVTTGCSHNKCTFCGAYKDKRFRIKSDAEIARDLDFAAQWCTRQRRLFLCDGDALVIPQQRLVPLLAAIRQRLPWVTRVATYASAKAVALKDDTALRELREAGLSLAYMGLESGDDATLAAVGKKGDSGFIVAQAGRLKAAGFKINVTVLLGLAGREGSRRHAAATGRALTAMQPEQAAALSLMLIPGTPLHADWEAGRFEQLSPDELLLELRGILEHTDMTGLFFANHASNYLPVRCRLPRDKADVLARIDAALAGVVALRPEWSRRL